MNVLRPAVEAFASISASSFRWLSKDQPILFPDIADRLDPSVLRIQQIQQLKKFLYSNFYIRGEPSSPRAMRALPSAANSQFVQDILRANSGRDGWHHGGVVAEIGDNTVAINRGRFRVYAALGECGPSAAPLSLGSNVSLRLGRSSLRKSPGFCLFYGERDLAGGQPILRFYWHLNASCAPKFVHQLTRRLNGEGLPFRLKVLADPLAYDRCDAGVLYVARNSSSEIAQEAAIVHASLGRMNDLVPAMTRRLAPGVAVADDPGNGESFGMHRCGLLAHALIVASERNILDIDERMVLVDEVFQSAGLDAERPHLSAGFAEPNLGTWKTIRSPEIGATQGAGARLTSQATQSNSDWLAAAARIAGQIVDEAIWYRDRCQWLGAEPVPRKGIGAIDYRTLPAGLYSGCAGVALFLAEFASRTENANAKRTALGAIRQALKQTTKEVGLYPGATGVALAAGRIGRLLRDDWLIAHARKLAKHTLRRATVPREHDLMYGNAGRVVGAFALESVLKVPAEAAAKRYGDALFNSAEPSAGGCSWPGQDTRWTHNLTGLSHGAAGVAHALALLWRRTGDERYRSTAVEAVAYEQALFDVELGNWPDLRPPLDDHQREERRYSLYWCHGAPGIAIQRLAFAQLLNAPEYLEQARAGMETTAARLAKTLRRNVENYSLCHGLFGNAEILIELSSKFEEPSFLSLAKEAAEEGLRLYGASGKWPCGTIQGDTPSLMLGRAGIGYFYLRLVDPAIPSVLLIDPSTWGRAPPSARWCRDPIV